MNKTLMILRATSGSGKNLFSDSIKSLSPDTVIVSADDYFMVDGEYRFNVSKLAAAHGDCQRKFKNAVDNGEELIIVNNTNVDSKSFSYYEDYGKDNGYTVFFIVLENRHNGQNLHSVSEQTLINQEQKLRGSLKLR